MTRKQQIIAIRQVRGRMDAALRGAVPVGATLTQVWALTCSSVKDDGLDTLLALRRSDNSLGILVLETYAAFGRQFVARRVLGQSLVVLRLSDGETATG
jgi:hypothetical protein